VDVDDKNTILCSALSQNFTGTTPETIGARNYQAGKRNTHTAAADGELGEAAMSFSDHTCIIDAVMCSLPLMNLV